MATSSKTRVVVAHDYAVVAAGIASTLGREPDLDVAIRSSLAHRTEADIVIGSCREAVKLVCESLTSFGRPPKIVMATTQESEAEIREAPHGDEVTGLSA